MENELDKTTENSTKQQVVGIPFDKNDPRINKDGRPKETPEQKAKKKAMKEMIKDYKEKLAEALIEISPVLIAEALKGNIQAIKEINDRVMGKPEMKMTGDLENPLITIIKYANKPDTTPIPPSTEKLPDTLVGGV